MIDIIIPHYGSNKLLEECIESIMSNKEEVSLDYNFIIIDNNKDNVGFSAGVNKGFDESFKSGNDYVAIVNNDTIALKNPFQPCIEVLEGDSNCAIVSPKIVDYENHDRIVHAGGEQVFPNGVHRSGLVSLGQFNKQSKCKWLSFAVVVMKKEAIRKVGYLDPNMFLICSDSDWCYRARYFGYNCQYTPDSVWAHRMGESSGATSEKSRNIQRKDIFAFYKKYISQGKLFQQLDLEYIES